MTRIYTKTAVFFALLTAPSLVLSEQVQLTPSMDTSLYEDDQGDLANGSGDYLFFGKVGSTPAGAEKLRRALIMFDVSVIPPEAAINSVTVTFEINQVPMTSPSGGTATLHRVDASWGEGASHANGNEGQGIAPQADDATWIHRMFPGTNWTAPGGDYSGTPSASEGYGLVVEELKFDSTAALQSDVKAWVNNSSNNHGWILLGNESLAYTARRVYARESNGFPVPLLTVDYTIPSPTDNLELTEIASGLNRPVAISNANDGSGRIFIVEQTGLIKIFDTQTQNVLPTPYLNLSGLITGGGSGEQGLLGLAFHPDFTNNRQFYVYYIRDNGASSDRSVLAMYQQNDVNPNIADAVHTNVLMEFEQNQSNHNGGDLHFDKDGYLNIASGDGGGGGDPTNNAQNTNELKGKILRIDVDGSPPVGAELCGISPAYGIPPGNAFPGNGNGCDEILHLGLRNPWKFSFDAMTEEMYIGDVGQGDWEEVDYAAPGASGVNYGWPCLEGTHFFKTGTCIDAVDPIFEYASSGLDVDECSITGGYVYRGSGTAMNGYYVYGDYCSSRLWLARKEAESWNSIEWEGTDTILTSISAFGQDEQCELYVADLDAGKVYRIDDTEFVHRAGFEALRCQ